MKHFFYLAIFLFSHNLHAATGDDKTPERRQGLCEIFSIEMTTLLSDAGINAINFQNSFANFEAVDDSQAKALQMARAFIRHQGPEAIGLFLTGTGKTHLSVAVAREALDNKMCVLFVTPSNLGRIWTTLNGKPGASKEELLAECDLIIFDGLEMTSGGPFFKHLFEDVLATAQRLGSKKILLTSNYDLNYFINAVPDLNEVDRNHFRRRVEAVFQSHTISDGKSPKASWFTGG